MTDRVENYNHLWAEREGAWALFQVNRNELGQEPRFIVVNRLDKTALIIEDDAVAMEVKQKMLLAGVPIVWPGNGF